MATEDIKKLVGTDRLIIGTDLTIKGLKRGELAKVYTTTNCPQQMLEDIAHYAKLAGVEVVSAGMENEELGIVCKRRHSVSVLGVKK